MSSFPGESRSSWVSRGVLLLAILSGSFTLIGSGFVAGRLYCQQRFYHEQYLREREMIEPLLVSDSAFSRINISQRSSDGIDLTGYVNSKNDLIRLQDAIGHLVGTPRAKELLLGVLVAPY